MPGRNPVPEGGIHLGHFKTKDEALEMMETFDYMLKHHNKYKGRNLIASRPRAEAGGWAVYAIPRPK
jgi:hypothetical protein